MRSLRGRLTLGITLLLAVVLAGAGIMVAQSVTQSEHAALDDRLKRTAELLRETALAAVQEDLPERDRRLDRVLSATGGSLRVLLAGREVLRSGEPPPGARPAAPGLHTLDAGGERYRTYAIDLEDDELGGIARLEVTSRLAPVEERLRDLRRNLLGFGILALVVAAVGVWFATDVLLRPLEQLRRATAGIAGEEDLSRRVPGDGPVEVRSLAASFNDMLTRLGRSAAARERALAATRRFTADAGHELRTPLTSVQATLSALQRHPDIAPEQRSEMLADALAEQRRLVDLLDGLQALARGDAAPVERGEVDLAEVVAVACEAARTRHPQCAWSCTLPDGEVMLQGWETGLRMLVENLLENAARHGGGTVAVELAGAVLTVDDDGPGVAEVDRERIFEPFVRAGDPDRAVPGSGLGLALVAQQARAHAATVEVSMSPLGGARFSVRFDVPKE